jgi:hypothetical protein
MPRNTAVPLSALILSGVVALVGCSSTDTASAPLTAEQLIEQGNAICDAGDQAITAQAMQLSPDGPPTGDSAVQLHGTVTTEVQKMVDGLRALTPPSELEADYAAMIAEADKALAEIKAETPEEFFASEEDAFAAANEIANKIGLTVCGNSE